jgi:hypothetical protein
VRRKNDKGVIIMQYGQIKARINRMLRRDVAASVNCIVGELEELADELARIDARWALAVAEGLEAIARRIRFKHRKSRNKTKYALYGEGE